MTLRGGERDGLVMAQRARADRLAGSEISLHQLAKDIARALVNIV